MEHALRERGEHHSPSGHGRPFAGGRDGAALAESAGERALKGVILYTDSNGELQVIAGLNFQASWVHSLQRRLPFDDVQ